MTVTDTRVDRGVLISGALLEISQLQEQKQKLAPAATRGDQKALDERTRLSIEIGKLEDYVQLQRDAIEQDRLTDLEKHQRQAAERQAALQREFDRLWGAGGRLRLQTAWERWLREGCEIVEQWKAWRREFDPVAIELQRQERADNVAQRMSDRLRFQLPDAFGVLGLLGPTFARGLEPLETLKEEARV